MNSLTQQTGSDKPPGISTKEVFEMIQKNTNIVLLDVRTPAEYTSTTGHIKNAILIPIQELEKRIEELNPYKDKTIIAYCRTGNRSGVATMFLRKKGFTVMNMEGGIVKWNDEKLSVDQEK